jgi:hypothetical protein
VQKSYNEWIRFSHCILFLSFSNLALKQNIKLSTPSGKQTAWRRESNIRHDWLDSNIPTLIIGLSMASGKSDF